jgi:hypothetical protein
MATRKAADHTLYHLSPKGFWKKFRELCFWKRPIVRCLNTRVSGVKQVMQSLSIQQYPPVSLSQL